MQQEEDLTADGLWRRVANKRAVSEAMVSQKAHCVEAYIACGCAVEFAIKAVIIQRRRWNAWPSRDEASGLYTHDLRALLAEAGIDLASLPKVIRPKLRQALDWTRGHEYHGKKMPRCVAASMFDAVFGSEGVISWLQTIDK